MAFLEVSDVLDDPDFVDDGLVVSRLKQFVDARGRGSVVPTRIPISGVVTSADGDRLHREIQGGHVGGSIRIHTRFALIAGADGYDADEVAWRGRVYTVVDVNDYTHFGAGFTCATCVLKPLAG